MARAMLDMLQHQSKKRQTQVRIFAPNPPAWYGGHGLGSGPPYRWWTQFLVPERRCTMRKSPVTVAGLSRIAHPLKAI
jgi:hypothetical protein